MSPSIQTIPSGFEVVFAFLWLEQVTDFADLFPEGLVGSGGGLADQSFEFGKCHLDRVEVGGVGWQEDQVIALCPQQFEDAMGFVGRQIVGMRRIRK